MAVSKSDYANRVADNRGRFDCGMEELFRQHVDHARTQLRGGRSFQELGGASSDKHKRSSNLLGQLQRAKRKTAHEAPGPHTPRQAPRTWSNVPPLPTRLNRAVDLPSSLDQKTNPPQQTAPSEATPQNLTMPQPTDTAPVTNPPQPAGPRGGTLPPLSETAPKSSGVPQSTLPNPAPASTTPQSAEPPSRSPLAAPASDVRMPPFPPGTMPQASIDARSIVFRQGAWPFGTIDPKLKESKEGPTIQTTTRNMTVRAAKVVVLGDSYKVITRENYPGGSAGWEVVDHANASPGGGAKVEFNAPLPWSGYNTAKRIPGQPDVPNSTAMIEFVGRYAQMGYELRERYQFQKLDGAKRFAEQQEQSRTPVLDLVKEPFRDAQPNQTGVDRSAVVAPISLKLYGSVSGADVSDVVRGQIKGPAEEAAKKAIESLPPFLKVGPEVPQLISESLSRPVAALVGAYGEVSASIQCAAKLSQNKILPLDNSFDQSNDLNSGGYNSWTLQCTLDGRALGAISIGPKTIMAGYGEISLSAGVAGVMDKHWNTRQHTYMTEYHSRVMDHSQWSWFRDLRYNDRKKPSGIVGRQGQFARFKAEGGSAKVEIRENLVGPDGKQLSDRETLMASYRADVEHATPRDKLSILKQEGYGRLFSKDDWETPLRVEYESSVAGRPVSDSEWDAALDKALTDKGDDRTWFSKLIGWGDAERKWVKKVDSQRKDIYAHWGQISQDFLTHQSEKLDKMNYHQLYKAAVAEGLRLPAVYLGGYGLKRTEIIVGAGATNAVSKSPRKQNRLPGGLYQFRGVTQIDTEKQYLSLGSTPEAWPEFHAILNTPGMSEAAVKLYNRYDPPRYNINDPDHRPVEPSILSFSMYTGVTPTREWKQHEISTGARRDLSQYRHIYSVKADDQTFTDIGRRAFQQLEGRAPTEQEAADYGLKIRNQNFRKTEARFGTFAPGLGESNPQVFEGAYLLLPPIR